MTADISDGHLNDQSVHATAKVDKTWTVEVHGFCHSIDGGIAGACPSGKTQFCENEPIDAHNPSHARDACEACTVPSSPCFNVANGAYNVQAFFRTGFEYARGRACGTQNRPGDIIDPACRVYGRWAP
jgi:hypothetical protein